MSSSDCPFHECDEHIIFKPKHNSFTVKSELDMEWLHWTEDLCEYIFSVVTYGAEDTKTAEDVVDFIQGYLKQLKFFPLEQSDSSKNKKINETPSETSTCTE